MEKKKRINPSFLESDWEVIKNYGETENRSMSDIVREFALKGMKRELLDKEHIAAIKNLVHAEVETVAKKVDELREMEMKSCEAAATSMYLLEYFCSNIKMANKDNVANAIQDSKRKSIEYVLAEEEEDA